MHTSTKHIASADHTSSLHTAGLRATPHRLQLLSILEGRHFPLSLPEIEKEFGRTKISQVTIYRMLEICMRAGIVVEVKNAKERRFELAQRITGSHHHHITCTNCGTVEDIEECRLDAIIPSALTESKKFKTIGNHSLELFGTCTDCTRSSTRT